MQTIDTSAKAQHLNFSIDNLTMPMALSHAIDAQSELISRIENYTFNIPLIDIVQQHYIDGDISQYCYLPKRNVLIYAGNKAGSTSVQAMLNKLEHDTGEEERTINLTTYALLNLIESRDPEIWYIYRDPVSRFISFFYFIGYQEYIRHGVRWDWRGVDMFTGTDSHRRPQFMFLPGYINNPQIHQRIIDIANLKLSDTPHEPISQAWSYDMLKDFIPYKKVKFYWLHEKGTPNRTNPIEIMYNKLFRSIENPNKPDVLDHRYGYWNSNPFRPEWEDIPREFKQKIWDATIPEREFLSKITWQNGPINFHGLS